MIVTDKDCPQCNNLAIFNFGEKVINNKLLWSASHICLHCGYNVEFDDYGALPQELRSLVLEEEGVWKLESLSTDAISLQAIYQILKIPIQELVQLKKENPLVIYEGTQTETEYYFSLLVTIAPNIHLVIARQ